MLIQAVEIQNRLIDLRRQSRFWKSQHHRAVQREEVFKEEIYQLKRTLKEQYGLNEQLIKDKESQAARISWLEQQLFGRKSEKAKPSNTSLEIANQGVLSDTGSSTSSSESTQDKRRKRGKQEGAKGYGRKRRDELPFEEIFIDAPEELLRCSLCGQCSSPFPGTEDSEIIDWQITLIRLIYRRKRYRRTCNCQNLPRIFSAPPVPKLIPKGMFSSRFWTQLLIEKFLFQRPLYRIRQALSLEGLYVSGGTLIAYPDSPQWAPASQYPASSTDIYAFFA